MKCIYCNAKVRPGPQGWFDAVDDPQRPICGDAPGADMQHRVVVLDPQPIPDVVNIDVGLTVSIPREELEWLMQHATHIAGNATSDEWAVGSPEQAVVDLLNLGGSGAFSSLFYDHNGSFAAHFVPIDPSRVEANKAEAVRIAQELEET